MEIIMDFQIYETFGGSMPSMAVSKLSMRAEALPFIIKSSVPEG
jgi:hypothetical protein